jgi:hypothetical protein
MKKIFILLLALLCIFNGCDYSVANDGEEAQKINKLTKAVYEETTKDFAKYECKESRGAILAYYKKYFTNEMALRLTNDAEKYKNVFDNDPRYTDSVSTDDVDDGSSVADEYRVVKSIKFLPPVISGKKAVACVDHLLESDDGRVKRTEFHLIKTPKGWKIDNIIWGAKGAFEEPTTQGLSSIKDYTHWGQFYFNSKGKIDKH